MGHLNKKRRMLKSFISRLPSPKISRVGGSPSPGIVVMGDD